MKAVRCVSVVALSASLSVGLAIPACSTPANPNTNDTDASESSDGTRPELDGSGDDASLDGDGPSLEASRMDGATPPDPPDLDATILCMQPPLSALSIADTQVNQPYPAAAAVGGEIKPGTYFSMANNFYQGSTFIAGTKRAVQVVIDANTVQFLTSTNGAPALFQAFGVKYVTVPRTTTPTRLKLTGVCPAAAANVLLLLGYTASGNTLTTYDDVEKRVQVFSKE